MSSVIVEEITKVFRLYNRPVDRLKELILHKPFHKDFTALDKISFSLEKGDTLGVVGDNGAGKSTLLKILSGTLTPTRGFYKVNGIVSSLLELGSGFHPEMTGYENIFFYGSILGIDNSVMKGKVDDIIEFSELGDFIQYPIKTYSSGMYVRLAFSVATSVDPDILIVDEALAVGDQYFQRKCLERMSDFREKGKTIIYCSHDMYTIKTFCEKALWLEHGKARMISNSAYVANEYISYEQAKSDRYQAEHESRQKEIGQTSSFMFLKDLTVDLVKGKDLDVTFTVQTLEQYQGHLGWAILRHDFFHIANTNTSLIGKEPFLFEGVKKVHIHIHDLNLVNGKYLIFVGILDKNGYRPIAVESIEYNLSEKNESLYAICEFKSDFTVGQL